MKRTLIDYFKSTTKYQKLNHIIYTINTLKNIISMMTIQVRFYFKK